ncbi:hypothetical protein BHE74_00043336 [Ensete ventricosum]|nr:hypothetical protein BHE74_00043336 [Ensete ventricosum]
MLVRCMASSLVRTGFIRGSMTQGNGCYQHRCRNNTLEVENYFILHVAVDGIWNVCPEAGGPVQFPGFHGEFLIVLKHVICERSNMIDFDIAGELMCPAYQELCSSVPMSVTGQCPGSCSFNGDCIDGKCYCFLSFHGNDCSKSEST